LGPKAMKKKYLGGHNFFQAHLKKLRRLRWVDVIGIAVFFFILSSSAFFILRRPGQVIVTMRLFERDAPDFYFNRPRNLFVEKLKPGLTETDEIGRSAIEVVDVHRYLTGNLYQDVFVTLKVKTTYNRKTGQHSFNGKPILIGSFHTLRLKDIVLNGVIVDISDEVKTREKKTFIIEAYVDPADQQVTSAASGSRTIASINIANIDGVKNYLAEKIIPNLQMLDRSGNVVAEILSVTKSPGQLSYISNNRIQTVTDRRRTRVGLTLEVEAEKINDAYYFQKDTPLVVGAGKKIDFISDNLLIILTITSVREME